jgi:methyl-accepting chemotaxis protein
VFAWFARSERESTLSTADADDGKVRRGSQALTAFRDLLVQRVRSVNQTTAQEVSEAARHLSEIVERARDYVDNSQRALARLQGQGDDSLGRLIAAQASFLRGHAHEMSDRAAAQDERARGAAASAKSIADLAASIERLAGEARLLAVNARIESSRLGAQSAGFEVLASEMQRLSDEVAQTNERVGELAGRLGQDLPWIAQHARDFREAMEVFANTTRVQLDDTEKGVTELRTLVSNVARTGTTVMEDIMGGSRAALSHLQFQDVVSQKLRQLDTLAHKAQVETLHLLGAEPEVITEVPNAEYTMLGGVDSDALSQQPASGDVMLF